MKDHAIGVNDPSFVDVFFESVLADGANESDSAADGEGRPWVVVQVGAGRIPDGSLSQHPLTESTVNTMSCTQNFRYMYIEAM